MQKSVWHKFKEIAGISLFSALASCAPVRYDNLDIKNLIGSKTLAELALESFPDKIPGAKAVEKYPVSGARYCLVHIRQKHYAPGQEEERKKSVIEAQNSIYDILSFLIKDNRIKQVYSEGNYDKKRIGQELKDLRNLYGLAQWLEDIVGKEKDINARGRYSFDLIYWGADLKLALEKRLKILPAEEKEVYKKASEMLDNAEKESDDYKRAEKLIRLLSDNSIIKKGREDAILEKLNQQKGSLVLVVYGKAHDFKDNVEEWNGKNPEKKISLIKITPLMQEEIRD